ncbi:MAG: DNA polymerase III subunit gamma/tau [Coriobacteriales bacterium]|nr:DNA polymerase III subunit gamma/tau [Coriobacteriales bacterium]
MALSLYRKYRPETFIDVVGQEHIEQTLKNAVLTGTVNHAYLFTGPRGTGKTTTARLLAKALLCEQAPTPQPDGSCPQCLEIANGIHPDVYELDAASRTGVENVREEIIGRVQYAPTRGSYKIYIIDEVHMLSGSAFNALLKTLEEPPSHVVFILCTTDPHKIPATILSRCQRFDFRRLSEQEIVSRLRYICEQEDFSFEPKALELIAQRSQGGMRDAIGALEQVAVFGGDAVSYAAAEALLGEVTTSQLSGIAALIAARDVAGCFGWVASFTRSGTDIAQLTGDLTAHMRNLYVAATVGSTASLAEILAVDEEAIGQLRDQASSFGSVDRLAHILLVLGDLSTTLRTAANARLALEIALTRMTRPSSDLTLEALAARVELLELRGGGAAAIERVSERVAVEVQPAPVPEPQPAAEAQPAPEPQLGHAAAAESQPASESAPENVVARAPQPASAPAAEAQPATPAAFTPDTVRRLWAAVEKETKAKRKNIAMMFGGSKAHLNPDGSGLLIELPTDAGFSKTTLERPEHTELVSQIVAHVFGQPLRVTYTLGAPSEQSAPMSPAAPPAAVEVRTQPATATAFSPAPAPAPAASPAPSNPLEEILAASFGTDIAISELDASPKAQPKPAANDLKSLINLAEGDFTTEEYND